MKKMHDITVTMMFTVLIAILWGGGACVHTCASVMVDQQKGGSRIKNVTVC